LHVKDEECLDVMSKFYGMSAKDLWLRLSSWTYDYDTATYLLLMTRKRRGLPVRLVTSSRHPFKPRLVSGLHRLVGGGKGYVKIVLQSKYHVTKASQSTEVKFHVVDTR